MIDEFTCKHGKKMKWIEADVDGHMVAFNILKCDDCYRARWFVDSTGGHYDRVTDVFVRVLPEHDWRAWNKIDRDIEE